MAPYASSARNRPTKVTSSKLRRLAPPVRRREKSHRFTSAHSAVRGLGSQAEPFAAGCSVAPVCPIVAP